MKEYKESILVVSLNEEKGQEVAHLLADSLGMLYASCKEIVNYEVFDSKSVIEKCGLEYFEKKEKSAVKHISKFINAVIFVNYEYFIKGETCFRRNCNFVYVKAKKKQLEIEDEINKLAFEERDLELEKKCEYIVQLRSTAQKTVTEIINQFRREK